MHTLIFDPETGIGFARGQYDHIPILGPHEVECTAEQWTIPEKWALQKGKIVEAPILPPSREELATYAADRRWRAETGGIAVDGLTIATDRESQAMIGNAVQIAGMAGASIKFKAGGGFVELSPEQMTGIALTVAAHVQAAFAAEAEVQELIAAGEITTTEQIDAHAWPGSAA